MLLRWSGLADGPNPKAQMLPRAALAGVVIGEIKVDVGPGLTNEVGLFVHFNKTEIRCTEDNLLELLKPIIVELLRPGQAPRCAIMNGGDKPYMTWTRN